MALTRRNGAALIPSGKKIMCILCRSWKPACEFAPDESETGGHRRVCRNCEKACSSGPGVAEVPNTVEK